MTDDPKYEWLENPGGIPWVHAFLPWKGTQWRTAACKRGFRADDLQPAFHTAQKCERCVEAVLRTVLIPK